MYNLESAAQATGKAKNTIRAAILNGRISATQSATGRWEIDPAELHRVYPAVDGSGEDVRSKLHDSHILLEALQERQREQLEATIRDLRSRLDREAEERTRLTRLLTHESPRRSWLERLFGA